MTAETLATPLLLGLGVDELSVTPRAIPTIEEAVRAVDHGHATITAAQPLNADSPQQLGALLQEQPAT